MKLLHEIRSTRNLSWKDIAKIINCMLDIKRNGFSLKILRHHEWIRQLRGGHFPVYFFSFLLDFRKFWRNQTRRRLSNAVVNSAKKLRWPDLESWIITRQKIEFLCCESRFLMFWIQIDLMSEKSCVLLLQENLLKWPGKGVSDPIMCLYACCLVKICFLLFNSVVVKIGLRTHLNFSIL